MVGVASPPTNVMFTRNLPFVIPAASRLYVRENDTVKLAQGEKPNGRVNCKRICGTLRQRAI